MQTGNEIDPAVRLTAAKEALGGAATQIAGAHGLSIAEAVLTLEAVLADWRGMLAARLARVYVQDASGGPDPGGSAESN